MSGDVAGRREARPVGRLARAAATATVVLFVSALAALGLFRPADNLLTDWRFARLSHAPTGNIVLVEIDPASLRKVGVWPWPRHIYADLLDRLMAMGAGETVFDIDFSSASTPAEDQAFAAALQRAGGYADLAAFRQFSPVTGQLEVTFPLERFRAEADTVTVNVLAETDGVVRNYPAGISADRRYVPSLAGRLSNRPLRPGDRFTIDFSLDASAIDRISVADVLSGSVDPRRLAGKQVVIAATAQELRDFFTVPRYGAVPGGLLQILAAETLTQHRELRGLGVGLPIGMVLVAGAVFLALRRDGRLWRDAVTGVTMVAAVELAALVAQVHGLLVPTAPFDVAVALYLIVALLLELEHKRRLHGAAARERDAMRRILDQVIADNFDGVLVADSAGAVLAASGEAGKLLGHTGGLVGRQIGDLLPEGLAEAVDIARDDAVSARAGEVTLELALGRRTLEYVATRSQVEVANGAGRRVVCLTFRDITERRRSEERLAFLARHDPLTGVLSRMALIETIETSLADPAGGKLGVTLVMVDLGRFRIVNDMLGHAFGDQVMKEVARRLRALDVLAVGRIGGDSFAMALIGLLSRQEAEMFGQSVIDAVVAPYVIDERRAVLSAHVGITNSRLSGSRAEVMLSHADMALSSTKTMLGNAIEIFAPAMIGRLGEKQEMEAALRQAIAERQFEMHYQPLVRLADRRLVGAEALIRWHHPTLGSIPPVRFIPAAEETGLIVELGRIALEEACREASRWPASLRLSVNVSPVQFELGNVVQDVRNTLAGAGLDPHRLDLEITEGLFVDGNHPALVALERLRSLGIGVALDDFGTGYSSLSYLSRLPADEMKIDRSFVTRLPADAEGLALVRTVLLLAQTLRKRTIAEGIETEQQATLLAALGCEIGQGHHFGKPMPARDFRALALADGESRVALVG